MVFEEPLRSLKEPSRSLQGIFEKSPGYFLSIFYKFLSIAELLKSLNKYLAEIIKSDLDVRIFLFTKLSTALHCANGGAT